MAAIWSLISHHFRHDIKAHESYCILVVQGSQKMLSMESINETPVRYVNQFHMYLKVDRSGVKWKKSDCRHRIGLYLFYFAFFMESNRILRPVHEMEECYRVQSTRIWLEFIFHKNYPILLVLFSLFCEVLISEAKFPALYLCISGYSLKVWWFLH